MARVKGLPISLPLDLVSNQFLRVLMEEKMFQFSLLKYTLASSNLTLEDKQAELKDNLNMLFPWIEIEKEKESRKEESALLKYRDKLLAEN